MRFWKVCMRLANAKKGKWGPWQVWDCQVVPSMRSLVRKLSEWAVSNFLGRMRYIGGNNLLKGIKARIYVRCTTENSTA